MSSAEDRGNRVQRAVSQYLTDIIRLAYTYLRSIADAEDIAQEVFMTYLQKVPTFETDAHEKAWLIRVTINKCKDQVKSSWYRKLVPLNDQIGYLPITDTHSVLLNAVLALDEKYRVPVHLFYYEGYAIKEIAQILQTPASTIATRLERGRNQIRKKLEETNSVHFNGSLNLQERRDDNGSEQENKQRCEHELDSEHTRQA